MTGPEHYREAERLIEQANEVGHDDPQRGAGILASAQTHATLALAAAYAEVNPTTAWTQVAGTPGVAQ